MFAQAPARAIRRTETSHNPKHTYRVGNGVSAPTIIFKKELEYSEEAKRALLQGRLTFSFVVASDGRAQKITSFYRSALVLTNARCRHSGPGNFKPATKDGRNVPVYATADTNFCLPGTILLKEVRRRAALRLSFSSGLLEAWLKPA